MKKAATEKRHKQTSQGKQGTKNDSKGFKTTHSSPQSTSQSRKRKSESTEDESNPPKKNFRQTHKPKPNAGLVYFFKKIISYCFSRLKN